ncbi:MAG: hypothetical protein ACFFDT_00830 [Candidatus Hodarchaeota archaeon]
MKRRNHAILFFVVLSLMTIQQIGPIRSVGIAPSGDKAFSYVLSDDFSLIGYYTNSSSAYADAGYHILKYNDLGNSLVPFTDFNDLSQFSMIIIPFKENWTPTEITYVTEFLNGGGIAFLTWYCPSELLSVTISSRNGLWTQPTDLVAQTDGDKVIFNLYANYSHGFRDLSWTIYPYDIIRPTKYIPSLSDPQIDVLLTAHINSDGSDFLGYAMVTKKIGAGRIVYSTISLFDLWAIEGIGGPTLPYTTRGTIGDMGSSGDYISPILNRLLVLLYLMEEKSLPSRWHTPFSKLHVINSRDDVDTYYSDAVINRGKIDQKYGLRTIFYELSDNIPEADWPAILNTSEEFPLGYHIPGYHRYSTNEASAEDYLARVLDIEAETGRPMYFECHHGGGSSGYSGQTYSRSAIEATNDLDHFVIYTSKEGSGSHVYVEPYLYVLANGTVIKAKNYYHFTKWGTIDGFVNANNVVGLQSWLETGVLPYERHIHYLLHSQNVRTKLTTSYDNLLTQGVDPYLAESFTDPIEYMKLSLDYVENVSVSFRGSNSIMEALIECNNDIRGYTFAIPFPSANNISSIELDGSPISINSLKLIDRGHWRLGLFHANLALGSHNLIVNFGDEPMTITPGIPEFIEPSESMLSIIIILVPLGLATTRKRFRERFKQFC